jgi:hypothetical protein
MLARLPSIEETCKAIFSIDVAKLDKELVELLLLNLPPHEEIKMVHKAMQENVVDESNVWDTAEEFIIALSGVPHFQLRLQAWGFENSFLEHFLKISEAQQSMLVGCERMVTSQAIRHLLAVVLAAGNYLNGGTPRGRADGFAIDTLTQVRTVKMSQASSTESSGAGTLIDYLVQQMEAKYGGELGLIFAEGGDAEKIRSAAKGRLEETGEELQAFQAKAAGMLLSVSCEGPADDAALTQHREILCMCLAELEELQRRQQRLRDKYKEVCSWFHMEDASSKKTCGEFFGIVDSFMREIFQAHSAFQEQERKASKRRERERSRSFSISRSRSSMCIQDDSSKNLEELTSVRSISKKGAAAAFPRSSSAGPSSRKGIYRPFSSSLSSSSLSSAPPPTMSGVRSSQSMQRLPHRLEHFSAVLGSDAFSLGGLGDEAVRKATRDYVAELVSDCLLESEGILN